MEEKESITVNCEVRVHASDGIAQVTVPPELRLTERLVSFLHAALKQRDLELKHWTITLPEQEQELEKLPNVVMGKEQE
jgi:hypothetical protein